MFRLNECWQQDTKYEILLVKSCFSRPIVVSISMIVTQHSGEEGGGRICKELIPTWGGWLGPAKSYNDSLCRSFSKHQKENLEELLKLFI